MAKNIEKIRQEWIQSCEFHPHTNSEVLSQVQKWIRREVKANQTPVLLLDLDSTLYEVETRSQQILREWVESEESRGHRHRDRLASLEREHMGYALHDTFAKLGLTAHDEDYESLLKATRAFWGERFFTNEYLAHDRAYPGAAEFVQEAYEGGAEIIYLTGRDEPGMGKGTRARLVADRFPFERPRTHLLLKKSFELDDLAHKSAASEYVKGTGHLVASFENEPPNLIALSDLFPAAMHVFVDTVYSDRPATPKTGLYRITGFRD